MLNNNIKWNLILPLVVLFKNGGVLTNKVYK